MYSQIELFTTLALLLTGAAIGAHHGGRIIRKAPEVSLETVHRHMQKALIIVAGILVAVVVLNIAGVIRSVAWWMPLVLELTFPFLKWGGIAIVFGYLASLSLRVARHCGHREIKKLTFAVHLLALALLILRWQANRPITSELTEATVVDGIVLQTSGSSCVPATVANILGCFGVEETEKALVNEMGTTRIGTTQGRVALALWRRGFRCKRVTATTISQVKPPAALTVDHPSTGPESHMVGFMGMNGDTAEIWDPICGKVMMDPERISSIWHGKALEVYKP